MHDAKAISLVYSKHRDQGHEAALVAVYELGRQDLPQHGELNRAVNDLERAQDLLAARDATIADLQNQIATLTAPPH